MIAIVGAANAAVQSGFFVEEIAEHTPVAGGALDLAVMPSTTAFALEWKEHLSTAGVAVGASVLVAALVAFAVTKNEDTRLQAVLVITSRGFASALVLWGTVGILLVLLPTLAGA
ncbi:MAG: hypothetical protein ACREQZ_02465 [Woeseiaceae bacterium]